MIDTLAPTAQISLPELLTCDLLETSLSLTNPSGSGSYSYSWEGPVGGIANGEATATATVIEPGSYQVSLTDSGQWLRNDLSGDGSTGR